MIEWFKNKRRKKRLLFDEKRFKRLCMKFDRDFYIRQTDKIKQAIMNGDMEEVKQRGKAFRDVGIIPPESLTGCETLIRDISEWRPYG